MQASFTIEADGENQLKLRQIVREEDGNRESEYDQLTYRVLKQCDQTEVVNMLLLTFKMQTKIRTIF